MVMGAGAVGGYFGGRLAEKNTAVVTLIARGDHLKAIRKEGLIIQSDGGQTTIRTDAFEDPAHAARPDLILFTVKSYDTDAAIEQVAPMVTENTQILTLQNGIENYPKLVQAFGEERVIQGFCKIGAGILKPGTIVHKAFGEVTAGEQDGKVTPRTDALKRLFESADIPINISKDIQRDVWLKFSWNTLLNMVTAAGNVTVEKIFEQRESEELCYRLFEEVRDVASSEGVILSAEDGKKIIESAKSLTGFETSTYQDRQKGKKMEYEAFTGAIVRLAKEHGLQVPYNEALYAILKLVELGEGGN